VQEIQAPQKISMRWDFVSGRSALEVFKIGEVEYVVGAPPDLVYVRKNGERIPLRRFDGLTRVAVLCTRHKAYQGKRKPRSGCNQCLDAYNKLHEV
jgi:hypothetical protein